MKKIIVIIFITLSLFYAYTQDAAETDDDLDIELFEDPENKIFDGEEDLEIFEDEEEDLEIFDDYEEDIFADDIGDPGVFEDRGDKTTGMTNKFDFMDEFFKNKSGLVETQYYYYFDLLKMEENANPEPDRKRQVFQQHSEFSSFVSNSIWRLDFTAWVDIGNQKNTYIPANIDLEARDWQDWFQDTERERRYFKISFLYLSLFFPICDISLGKKDFVNTLSTLYSPADNYRAVDSNEPFFPQIFGTYQFETDFFLGNTTLALVIFPIYQGGKNPSAISRWAYYKAKEKQDEEGAGLEDAEDTEDSERRYTDIAWENISYLVKAKTTFWGIDLFLSGFYGLAGNTVGRIVDDEETEEVEKEAEVVHVINGTAGFATTIEKFEIHGEALYNFTPGSKDDDYLRYVGGGRYAFDGFPDSLPLDKIELTLEYAGEVLFKQQSNADYADSTEERRGLKNDLLGLLLFQFTDKLKFTTLGHYNINEASVTLTANIACQWLGNLELNFGGQVFFAPDGSDLYYWRDNNRLTAEITYTF